MLATDFRCTLAQAHSPFAFGQQGRRATAEFDMGNRALQEIGGAGVECGQSALAVLMRCYDNRGNLASARHHPDFADEFRPVHLGHAIVNNHKVRSVVAQPIQRFDRIGKSDGGIFFPHQRHKLSIDSQIGGSIIDYQDTCAHS